MRVVLQRVAKASCQVENVVTGSIGAGLLILVGIESGDSLSDIEWICKKVIQMRIFSDEEGLMNKSIVDIQGDILLISQFTLLARTKKGNRPSFINAARPDEALPLYEKMCEHIGILSGKPVAQGVFGADMKIELINDGPVTIMMDSREKDRF